MSSPEKLGQKPIKELKFAGCSPERIIVNLARIHGAFNLLEYKGMVTEFSELHNHVTQSLNTVFSAEISI